MLRKLALAFGSSALLAFVLVGCGGTDTGGTGTTETSTEASTDTTTESAEPAGDATTEAASTDSAGH
ncbi:MAG: hypothetical protein KDB03_18550 [Planctomycetales bacterium]|nr:hypothetical protein [Planctomycetales bacterium]